MKEVKEVKAPVPEKYFSVFPYICAVCSSQSVMYKKKTKGYWCRRCGASFRVNEKEKIVTIIDD